LYFGENDPNTPLAIWFENLNVNCEIVENEKHEMYKNKDFALQFCSELISNLHE